MSEVTKYFEETFPARIAKHSEGAKTIGCIYLFKITGDDGGTWTINLKDDIGVKAGDSGNAECTLELSSESWLQLMQTPGVSIQLFFEGKLKVSGNVMLAMKLQQLMSLDL